MPDPQKLLAYLMKLVLSAMAVLIAWELLIGMLKCLIHRASALDLIGLGVISPIAYFVLQAGRPREERRPRRGAERTPLLPSHEVSE